jgi:Flp pilus assembly protein TadD
MRKRMTSVSEPLDAHQTICQAHKLIATASDDRLPFMRRAVERFPEDPELRLLYAGTIFPLSAQDAGWNAARAIELDPDDPGRLTRAARLMLYVGDVASAGSYAERAARYAPDDFLFASDLTAVRGLVAALNGDPVEAETLLRSAHEAEPDCETYALDLARFLDQHGRGSEAIHVRDLSMSVGAKALAVGEFRDEIATRDRPRGGD